MSKLPLLCVALCAILLLDTAFGHPVCFYTSGNLNHDTEETCREACVEYNRPKFGRCFAYRFSFRDNRCTVYVFSTLNKFVDYTDCGANYGGDVSLEQPSDAQGSEESTEGCRFSVEVLGIASAPSKCAKLCTSFFEENDSRVFGGCAAWFWDPNDDQCVGLMTEESSSSSVCGTV